MRALVAWKPRRETSDVVARAATRGSISKSQLAGGRVCATASEEAILWRRRVRCDGAWAMACALTVVVRGCDGWLRGRSLAKHFHVTLKMPFTW